MFTSNEYFEGKVKSIAFGSQEGPATIGVMDIGEYEFGTNSKEFMSVVSGSMEIRFPGSTTWKSFTKGESFEVAKGVKFGVRVEVETSYLCLYK